MFFSSTNKFTPKTHRTKMSAYNFNNYKNMDDPNDPMRFLPQREDYVYGQREYFREIEDTNNRFDIQPPAQDEFATYKHPEPAILDLPADSYFYLNVSGQFEFAEYPEVDSLQIKYDIAYGDSWRFQKGKLFGHSQIAYKSHTSARRIVWNFPFEVAFASTNPKGWPQIVIECTGPDFLGRHVIKGYGTIHFPTQPGRHYREIKMYTPKSSSKLVHLIGILKGTKPELFNPVKTLAFADGREVTRMESAGKVRISFNCTQKNMQAAGYSIK